MLPWVFFPSIVTTRGGFLTADFLFVNECNAFFNSGFDNPSGMRGIELPTTYTLLRAAKKTISTGTVKTLTNMTDDSTSLQNTSGKDWKAIIIFQATTSTKYEIWASATLDTADGTKVDEITHTGNFNATTSHFTSQLVTIANNKYLTVKSSGSGNAVVESAFIVQDDT